MNDELVVQIYKNLAWTFVMQVAKLIEPDIPNQDLTGKLIATLNDNLFAMKEFVAHDTRVDFEIKDVVFDADICGALGHRRAHEFGPSSNEVKRLHFVLKAVSFQNFTDKGAQRLLFVLSFVI